MINIMSSIKKNRQKDDVRLKEKQIEVSRKKGEKKS